MHRTMDQHRAKAAWGHVGRAIQQAEEAGGKPNGKNWFGEYKALVDGAPAVIHSTGLGQATAFYLSKGKDHHVALLTHLAQWVLRDRDADELKPDLKKTPDDLIMAIQNDSSEDYRMMTQEAQAYLVWLKRFAAARST